MNYKTDQIIKTAVPMLLYSLFALLLKLELSFSIGIGIFLFIGVRICLWCVECHRAQERYNDLLAQFLFPKGAKPSSTEEFRNPEDPAGSFFPDEEDQEGAKELSELEIDEMLDGGLSYKI